MGGVEGVKIVIRIYYVKKNIFSVKRKKKNYCANALLVVGTTLDSMCYYFYFLKIRLKMFS